MKKGSSELQNERNVTLADKISNCGLLDYNILLDYDLSNIDVNHLRCEDSDTDVDNKLDIEYKSLKIKKRNERGHQKVVVRHLPPELSEEEFLELVSPLPEHNYFCFVPANDYNKYCRVYINFTFAEDIITFAKQMEVMCFVDVKGTEFHPIVELAIFQIIPKQRSARKKRDNLCGTLVEDSEYISFVEKYNAIKQGDTALNENFFDLSVSSHSEEEQVTPLIEYIRERRNASHSSRINRREEIRRREETRRREEIRRKEYERRWMREEAKRSKKEAMREKNYHNEMYSNDDRRKLRDKKYQSKTKMRKEVIMDEKEKGSSSFRESNKSDKSFTDKSSSATLSTVNSSSISKVKELAANDGVSSNQPQQREEEIANDQEMKENLDNVSDEEVKTDNGEKEDELMVEDENKPEKVKITKKTLLKRKCKKKNGKRRLSFLCRTPNYYKRINITTNAKKFGRDNRKTFNDLLLRHLQATELSASNDSDSDDTNNDNSIGTEAPELTVHLENEVASKKSSQAMLSPTKNIIDDNYRCIANIIDSIIVDSLKIVNDNKNSDSSEHEDENDVVAKIETQYKYQSWVEMLDEQEEQLPMDEEVKSPTVDEINPENEISVAIAREVTPHENPEVVYEETAKDVQSNSGENVEEERNSNGNGSSSKESETEDASKRITESIPSPEDHKKRKNDRRIKNKDRPSIQIYRPGMGRYSKHTLQQKKEDD